MKAYLTTHLMVAAHALIIAVVALSAAWYVDNALWKTESQIVGRIQETLAEITTLADLTDRNGADALTERIITDCPRRTEFENLLSGLAGATRKDLLAAQQLFESCGAFHAERKAFMVAQLERELALLSSNLDLLSSIRDLTPVEVGYTSWAELVELEKVRSAFLTEQTELQADIIRLLIEGESAQTITELVRQAQNVSESLIVTDAQIDQLRSKLTS
jgi:hypothetical protein